MSASAAPPNGGFPVRACVPSALDDEGHMVVFQEGRGLRPHGPDLGGLSSLFPRRPVAF